MKFQRILTGFFCSPFGISLLGAIIGMLFFGLEFGFSVVNPFATDWIWHGVTHDTAQHFIGWEFFRADSTGGVANGLAYPVGLPITFMDSIPLFAFFFKIFAGILPANFQYFGLWALLCYVLMGGIGAVLVRKIWWKIFAKSSLSSVWQILFVAAGALILVATPVILTRTLYHPALAAQWLVLLGILLVWDAKKFAGWWKFALVWSAMLVGAVLIHPYFLPLLGAMMVVAAFRNYDTLSRKNLTKIIAKIAVPICSAGAVFWAIGGFSLAGSADEFRDLNQKGFNLLSFVYPAGYSGVLPFAGGSVAPSGSPETMMWVGFGVFAMFVVAAILWRGKYRESWRKFRAKFAENKSRNIAIFVVAFLLFWFSVGIAFTVGAWTVFEYSVPQRVYDLWSMFRAAARESWPFYYAAILAIFYWFARGVRLKIEKKNDIKNTAKTATARHPELDSGSSKKIKKSTWIPGQARNGKAMKIVAILFAVFAVIQFADIFFSPNATTRREGFANAAKTAPELIAPNLDGIVTTQKNIVVLDAGFRGDQSGTYQLAQAALKNKLTLNIGFFARIPAQITTDITNWRDKIANGKVTKNDFHNNLFVTKDANFVTELSRNYTVTQRGDFYFITKKL